MAATTPPAEISLYILTYNCGLAPIDIDSFASQLFSGLTTSSLPDLLILSLQEIAPIPHALIGGSFLAPYFKRFHRAVQNASQKFTNSSENDQIYSPISSRNLGMTGIMAFAKDPDAIRDIETGGVGVGLAEMGNKAAVGVRFSYHNGGSSTELTFVAAHLAAMEDCWERRNEDWKNIVRGLVFSSALADGTKSRTELSPEGASLLSISPRDASVYKPTSHLFVAGDLNYRTSSLPPAPSDHINTFPQPSMDSSSPNHYYKLFELDQLNQERLAGRTCQGLTEAPVNFPPTYKYQLKEPFLTSDENLSRWNWAKHRWPSWCDRVLFLDMPKWMSTSHPNAKIVPRKYTALPLLPTSDHRPVSLEVTVPLIPISSPPDEDQDDPRSKPPFTINPDWRAQRNRARKGELVVGFLMYYTTTTEGGSILLAMTVGTIGFYIAIRAILGM
ncbi:hypothetical protein HYFRA_00001861 [Hymenoscyphus fraxineus]|uniref:Inositol polyphosphate-related phosphatase domain-containing protein n=1 Tax=Hymenoscyphus fraxineus TaxID=746836 RepID=A0A9N9PMB2_9HELO|nr:hypothetical protein HYFRA_00001861 [Hymenoscyphus fraxineus]